MIRTTNLLRLVQSLSCQLHSAASRLAGCPKLFLAAGLGVVLSAVSTAGAQTQSLTATTVSYDVRGTVKATLEGLVSPTPWGGVDFLQATTGGGDAPVTLQEEWETTVSTARDGEASAMASVFAHADFGKLQLGLSGALTANTNASTGRLNDVRGAKADMLGKVQARWQDTAIVNADGDPNGQIVFNAFINLFGNLDLNLTQPVIDPSMTSYVFAAGSSGDFWLEFTSSGNQLPTPPYPGGLWARTAESSSSAQIRLAPPHIIPVRAVMQNGTPFAIDYTLTLRGKAGVILGTDSRSPLFAASYFDADFTQSMYWGGITSINDALTGEPIENWSITSASGFDYSQPYRGVPEPSSLLLLSAGLLLSWWRCRRRQA